MNTHPVFFIILIMLLITLAETALQTCFKSAVDKVAMPADNFRQMLRLSWRLLFVFRVWVGMWLGLAVMWLWMVALSKAELNFVFSLSSAHYIFIALSSQFILKEKVRGNRWIGTVLIMIGIMIVSMTQ